MASVAQILRSKVSQAVWSVEASASVYDAIAVMAHRQVGALTVTHSGTIVGIVTERDYARKIVLLDRSSRLTPVREIMSTELRYVSPDQTAEHCMALMTEHRIRHLPVVDSGQVIGVVSVGDLIRNRIVEQEETIQQLEYYIHGDSVQLRQRQLQIQRTESMVNQ